MKKLNALLYAVVITLLFISCAGPRMQIVSLNCNNMNRQDTLWIKRDSIIKIGYYFYGKNCSTNFILTNISNKPVFFDKKNSFISYRNNQYDFWRDVSQVKGSLTIKQYRTLSWQTNNPINEQITRTNRIDMIAPRSTLIFEPALDIRDSLFNLSSYKLKSDTVDANWTKGKKTIIQSVDFTEQTSPLSFRYFISLSHTEDFKEPLYYDFTFWASNIMDMDARQGVKYDFPYDYATGIYDLNDKTGRRYHHPYKKAWRFYLTPMKPANN